MKKKNFSLLKVITIRRRTVSEYRLYCNLSVSFHGAEVNVTAKPFPPYWLEGDEEKGPGDSYHGTDYLLLQAVASSLNFTVAVVPTADWDEVRRVLQDVWTCLAAIEGE